jgi:6-phosphogluconolactonase
MAKQGDEIFVYVGTYTQTLPYIPQSKGEGLYVYRLDPATGALSYASQTEIINPSYLTIDPQKRHLYAISEVLDWEEGLVTAYSIKPETGELTYLNERSTRGCLSCYVVIDTTNRFALVANYMGGSVAMFPIEADGSLGELTDLAQHQGTGSDPARQTGPHAHCIVIDPANKFAYAADLGLDKMIGYKLDWNQGKYVPNDEVALQPGAGPRHFVFSRDSKYAYVIQELNSTITAFAYNADKGKLTPLQTVSTLPEGFEGHSHCADIHISPSGKFLYGSNRGHDSIVIFAIDQNTGKLAYVGHQPTQGKTPRNFAIDPTGTFLLAANQDTDTIVTFRLNHDTGHLEPTGQIAQVPTPICIKMVQMSA